MTLKQAAEVCGLSTRRIRQYIKDGLIHPRKLEGSNRPGKGRGRYSYYFTPADCRRIMAIKNEKMENLAAHNPSLYRHLRARQQEVHGE